MPNPYYNPSSTPINRSPGSSQLIRTEFASIAAGFDLLSSFIAPSAINRTALGIGAIATQDNEVALGNSAVTRVRTSGQYKSTIATGTAPLEVDSTTVVPNLYVARAQSADLVGQAAWVSGATYAVGNVVYSLLDFSNYRRTTNGGGIIDPRNDPTNWALITTTPEPYIRTASLQSIFQFYGAF